MKSPVIFWFRQDLRLTDNPGLCAALGTGHPVLCVYVLDDEAPGKWALGGASRWWLHHSLTELRKSIEARGGALILRRGKALNMLPALAREVGAPAVHWNRCYEPFAIERDKTLKGILADAGRTALSHNASLLLEPWELTTKSGQPYKVFTPFWRALWEKGDPPRPIPAPQRIPAPDTSPRSEDLAGWHLLPSGPDWADGLRRTWTPGEAGAEDRLNAFLEDGIETYKIRRDLPAHVGTSRLSAHLHFGEVSPRRIWQAVRALGGDAAGAEKFLAELGWRDFAHHLLYHFRELPEANWRSTFDAFPWRTDQIALKAWQRGRTGFPIVDAGMRELWGTGWMHNRVRMIAASVLVKHLLIDWREGEAWFWDTLVDADLANNAGGWQWVAGSGADASPYFRIFNPTLQGERYDPDGTYVRRWVPELAGLPATVIHKPWEADAETLKAAGVILGETYPKPLIAHAAGRERALAAYERIKET